MAAKRRTHWVVWLRRAVQTVFLLLFFELFLSATFHPGNRTEGPVTLFFNLDPLVALNTWLASHSFVRPMLLSLATVLVTLLAGRWFCGWLCPFGTLHNLCTSLRGGNTKSRRDTGGYAPAQRLKYYGLAAFLGAAVFGVNVVGWLDPFSFLYRSLATAVYPAFSAGVVKLFTWLYQANPLHITVLSEPAYDFLRKHVLPFSQPYYFGGVLIGGLFLLVLALNLFRARFWCRYVCPLGATLGAVGQRPLVRIGTDPEQCNQCGLCVAECQGGADPSGKWRAEECFYCGNCISECPSRAISFRAGRGAK